MGTAVAHVDFEEFHREVLPERLAAGNGDLAREDASRQGPLGLRLAGTDLAYTYVPTDTGIDVVADGEPLNVTLQIAIARQGPSYLELIQGVEGTPWWPPTIPTNLLWLLGIGRE